jgi:hypothetical protein
MKIAIVVFWLLCAIFSAILASHKHRSAVGWFFVGLLLGPFGLLVAFFPDLRAVTSQEDFEERWATLTKYDDAVRAAVDSLEAYSTHAIAELKKAYRAIGDPTQLPSIAEHIAREAEANRTVVSHAVERSSAHPHRVLLFQCGLFLSIIIMLVSAGQATVQQLSFFPPTQVVSWMFYASALLTISITYMLFAGERHSLQEKVHRR